MYALILRLLRRQPSWSATLIDLQFKLNLERFVTEPEIAPADLEQELDYLLLAGLILGDDNRGYRLTTKWQALFPDTQNDWCRGQEPDSPRPELEDPLTGLRLYRQTPYDWEQDCWFSFQFAVCQILEDLEIAVAMVSGLARNGAGMTRELCRERFSAALSAWYATPEGMAAWSRSCGDFNIGDLAFELGSDSLQAVLADHGLRDIKILTAFGSTEWQHDDVLGTLPTPVGAAE
jgi:hypothetical protein